MNNSNTPKIVVGVGLAAFYATGLAYFTLRGAPDDVVAAPDVSIAAAQIASADMDSASADSYDSLTDVGEQFADSAAMDEPGASPAFVETSPARSQTGVSAQSVVRKDEQTLASAGRLPAIERDLADSSASADDASTGSEIASVADDAQFAVRTESAFADDASQSRAEAQAEPASPSLANDADDRDVAVLAATADE